MTVKSINKVSLKQKLKNLTRHPASLIMFLITWGAALITIAVVIFLVAYILIKGVPNIKPSLFAWKYNSENVSMMPAIINTVIMTAYIAFACGAYRHFLGGLPDRVCKARQHAGFGGKGHNRNPCGNTVDSLRTFRLLDFRYCLPFSSINAIGRADAGHYDTADYDANHRGSACSACPTHTARAASGWARADYARYSRWCCRPQCREYYRALYCRSAELWAKPPPLFTHRVLLREYPKTLCTQAEPSRSICTRC